MRRHDDLDRSIKWIGIGAVLVWLFWAALYVAVISVAIYLALKNWG